MNFIYSAVNYVSKLPALIPQWLTPLSIRFSIFFVFWNSAQTRIYDWSFLGYNWKFWDISETAFYLFDEFDIPFISTEVSTYMATFAEFFLSLFILFGVLTRISAFGLLSVVLVIQLFAMPDSWQLHLLWASALIYLLKFGPGIFSVDHVLMSARNKS